MAYFNDNDNNNSTFSAPEEFGSYPFLQPQAFTSTGEIYDQGTSTFDGGWTAAEQSGFTVDPPTVPQATPDYGENSTTCFVTSTLHVNP